MSEMRSALLGLCQLSTAAVQVVVEALEGLMQPDGSLTVAIIKALGDIPFKQEQRVGLLSTFTSGNLCQLHTLQWHFPATSCPLVLQARAMQLVMTTFETAEVQALPAIIGFLLQQSTAGCVAEVITPDSLSLFSP